MYLKQKKGFTLIEMLLVIAIIGILSSVSLLALKASRNKAKDARIISAIQQIKAYMETTYDEVTGRYSGRESDTIITNLKTEISKNGGRNFELNFNSNYNKYAIYVLLNNGESYCIDSIGNSNSNSPFNGECNCPAGGAC